MQGRTFEHYEMDKKVGFGFKLSKPLKTVGSLFDDDDQSNNKNKQDPKLIFDNDEDDELRSKMGFIGFGKVKPLKKSATAASSVQTVSKDGNKEVDKPKARQFDLEKEISISREIASERKSQLEQSADDQSDEEISQSEQPNEEPTNNETDQTPAVDNDEELNEDESVEDNR